MDPVSLIVTALAVGAAAGAKPTATLAVKEAYAGLKRLIRDGYKAATRSVDQLQEDPESEARRAVVKEDLAKTTAATDAELLQQAQVVIDHVQSDDPEVARTFGLHLTGFQATEFEAEGLKTTSSTGATTGVHMTDTKIDGKASFKNIETSSGTPPPKPEGQ